MSASLRLALTGDSILQRRLLSRTDPVVRPLFDLVRGADLAFTNLEVLPNDYRGDPALESGGSRFGAPAWVLDELQEAEFGLFAAATNHCLDYSISGLLLSMKAMDRRGLAYAGVGRNLEDARRAAYVTHPHGTVALLSCSSTFAKGQDPHHGRSNVPTSRHHGAPKHGDALLAGLIRCGRCGRKLTLRYSGPSITSLVTAAAVAGWTMANAAASPVAACASMMQSRMRC